MIFNVVRQSLSRGEIPPFFILGEVAHRRPGRYTSYGRHRVDLTEYNGKVDDYNDCLRGKALSFPKLLGFWGHRDVNRLGEAPGALHPSDGVHLGARGDEKLYISFKFAASHAVEFMNGVIPTFYNIFAKVVSRKFHSIN